MITPPKLLPLLGKNKNIRKKAYNEYSGFLEITPK
jgi:hypothetical protein